MPGQSEGSTLSDSGRPYWQSAARVGMQVADALAHAASQGILHRDVKPSNLLLDETGNVWVTDFGLAKADDGDDLTHTGDVGTLRYMAPERFSGQGDVRSDVYSLGLTLYEMLTLRPAFDEADRNRLVRQVMHDEPARPRKLNPAVPRDLETVVLKAIARDPAQRYQSPAEMAEDLKRFVEDLPVRARRVSETERLWRWCRRNPLPAGLLAGLVLVFLAGFAGVLWQWREAEAARKDEKSQRGQAELARDEANDARNGEPARALHLFVQALRRLPAGDPEAAPLERVIRANLTAWAETVPALEHLWPGGPVTHPSGQVVAFSPDGEWVAMPVGKDEIRFYRTDVGRPVGPSGRVPDVANNLLFAPDGRSLWVTSHKGVIHRLDTATGAPLQPPIQTGGPIEHLAVTPDGRRLVAGVGSGVAASVAVCDTATGRVRHVQVQGELHYSRMGLSPDGKSVTAWVAREGHKLEGLTFAVDGTESPKSLGLNPWRKGVPAPASRPLPTDLSLVHFQHDLRTALVFESGQSTAGRSPLPACSVPAYPPRSERGAT